jgi:hypothetical protein
VEQAGHEVDTQQHFRVAVDPHFLRFSDNGGRYVKSESILHALVCGEQMSTVDLARHSCLAKACSNMGIATPLLEHGAIVTSDVSIQASTSGM